MCIPKSYSKTTCWRAEMVKINHIRPMLWTTQVLPTYPRLACDACVSSTDGRGPCLNCSCAIAGPSASMIGVPSGPTVPSWDPCYARACTTCPR
jgi:hypothetical protein